MGNVRHSHHRELDEKILLMVFSYKGRINKFKSMKPVYLFSFISVRCSEFSVLCKLHTTHRCVGVNPANSSLYSSASFSFEQQLSLASCNDLGKQNEVHSSQDKTLRSFSGVSIRCAGQIGF